jgi:predicted DNA-binding transcriptional regulator AlpA
MATTILRIPVVLRLRGRSRSGHYLDIQQGLFPHPVKIGLRAAGHPEHEVEAINTARIGQQLFLPGVFGPTRLANTAGRRRASSGLYAVMLDDVGTKVAMERLTLAPSWLLETSPGQSSGRVSAGEPLTDGGCADRLMNAIVAAGLCDPGANGPSARLARLPVAVNGKHTPPFACRMVDVVTRVALFG